MKLQGILQNVIFFGSRRSSTYKIQKSEQPSGKLIRLTVRINFKMYNLDHQQNMRTPKLQCRKFQRLSRTPGQYIGWCKSSGTALWTDYICNLLERDETKHQVYSISNRMSMKRFCQHKQSLNYSGVKSECSSQRCLYQY